MRAGVATALVMIGFLTPFASADGGYQTVATGEKTVEMVGGSFSPASFTISKGDKVTFVNKDAMCHDVAIEGLGDSGGVCAMNASATWSQVFESAGTFKFRCRAHSPDYSSGMVGTIIVTDPNAAPPPQRTPGFELVALSVSLAAAFALFTFSARRRRA